MQQKVIIADDAQFMRVMLRDILEDLDFTVVAEAASGEEAVTCYRDHQPDLVMLDITMPGMGGVACCRQILAEDPQARIIMVSALGQRDEVLAAMKSGARDFVVKPFEAERVEETLHRHLEPQAVG